MSRPLIEIMIDSADLRCTVCGSRAGHCDCWTKCPDPTCTWSYRKGGKCRNPAHEAKEER